MQIKEIYFRQQERKKKKEGPKGGKVVVLRCRDCGLTETRPVIDLYTGHMFDMLVTYTCTVCRGVMDLTQ
jgi:hypothetical protein